MLACGFGLTFLVLDFPHSTRCVDHGAEQAMEAAIQAATQTRQRLAIVSSLPENMPEHLAKTMIRHGVAPLMGLQAAISAAANAAKLASYMDAQFPDPLQPNHFNENELESLDEAQSKAILGSLGIMVPKSSIASDVQGIFEYAKTHDFPLVLKGLSAEVAHKTEVGAVALNLRTVTELETAANKIDPPYLIEEMVEGSVVELIVGIARDPQFGLFMTLGAGGVLVELLDDAQPVLLPTTRHSVRLALMSLKVWPVLEGFRNRPSADIEAVIDVAMSISDYAQRENNKLEELDINPLMACETGAIAADALIRIRKDPHE